MSPTNSETPTEPCPECFGNGKTARMLHGKAFRPTRTYLLTRDCTVCGGTGRKTP